MDGNTRSAYPSWLPVKKNGANARMFTEADTPGSRLELALALAAAVDCEAARCTIPPEVEVVSEVVVAVAVSGLSVMAFCKAKASGAAPV